MDPRESPARCVDGILYRLLKMCDQEGHAGFDLQKCFHGSRTSLQRIHDAQAQSIADSRIGTKADTLREQIHQPNQICHSASIPEQPFVPEKHSTRFLSMGQSHLLGDASRLQDVVVAKDAG